MFWQHATESSDGCVCFFCSQGIRYNGISLYAVVNHGRMLAARWLSLNVGRHISYLGYRCGIHVLHGGGSLFCRKHKKRKKEIQREGEWKWNKWNDLFHVLCLNLSANTSLILPQLIWTTSSPSLIKYQTEKIEKWDAYREIYASPNKWVW